MQGPGCPHQRTLGDVEQRERVEQRDRDEPRVRHAAAAPQPQRPQRAQRARAEQAAVAEQRAAAKVERLEAARQRRERGDAGVVDAEEAGRAIGVGGRSNGGGRSDCLAVCFVVIPVGAVAAVVARRRFKGRPSPGRIAVAGVGAGAALLRRREAGGAAEAQ